MGNMNNNFLKIYNLIGTTQKRLVLQRGAG